MEIFSTQYKGVHRLAEDEATEGHLCLEEIFPLSCVMHPISRNHHDRCQLETTGIIPVKCNLQHKCLFMFCIMFCLSLVSLTTFFSPGLNFVHCSFTIYRIFRNVALQVARFSYSSTEGTKPINKRFYKVIWQLYGGGGYDKKEELNKPGATEIEY